MENILTNAIQEIEKNSVSGLLQGLESIKDLTKTEISANESAFAKNLPAFINATRTNIRTNQTTIPLQMQIPEQLENLFKKFPRQLTSKFGINFGRLINEAKGATVESIAETLQARKLEEIENEIFNESLRRDDYVNLEFEKNPVLQTPLETIDASEQSIKPFEPLIKAGFSMTTSESAPKTVEFLAKYAQMEGLMPFGSVTNKLGSAYVGVKREQTPAGVVMKQFPQNDIPKSEFPSLGVKLRYYAQRAINSWNNYISDEAQLVDYMGKISTPANRTSFIENQFKTMNLERFAAEALASLVYYYVYIPMQNYMLYKHGKFSKEDFKEKYEVGNTPQTNPLLIRDEVGKSICEALLNEGVSKENYMAPSALFAKSIKPLKGLQNPINKKQVEKFLSYSENKLISATAFFESYGMPKESMESLMAVKNFSSVKKKPFALAGGLNNTQFAEVIKKIVDEEKDKTLTESISNLTLSSTETIEGLCEVIPNENIRKNMAIVLKTFQGALKEIYDEGSTIDLSDLEEVFEKELKILNETLHSEKEKGETIKE